MSDDDSAPGWDAIDAALEPLYGQQKPRHWAAAPHRALGGENPLDGVSAYEASGPRHWHFVSYGMSDLYQKETDDPEVSGWGFELTLRLKPYDETEPPVWALNFLNNLGRYVLRSGNPFDVGHHMDLNGPIALGSETAIRAITFARDVQLGGIRTPHGQLTFLQVVGLTLDEYDTVQTWDAEKFLSLMAKRDPMLLTDLCREGWLRDASFAREVDEGRRRDGSSQHVAFVGKAEWHAGGGSARVVLGAKAVQSLLRVLPWRLPFGRSFAVAGSSQTIRFDAAESAAWHAEPDILVVTLTPDSCQRFCERLVARRGSYRWDDLPGFEIEVVPSEIKDPEGRVIQVLG